MKALTNTTYQSRLVHETSLTVELKGTHEYDADLNGEWNQAVRFKC